MSVEDKKLGRLLQREVTRHQSVDTEDAVVTVNRSVGYITGVIRPTLGVNMNPKEEEKALKDLTRRVPGLRDIVVDVKWEMSTKK